MSTSITVTIGERLAALGLLNAGKFNNSTLAVVLDDIKKIVITEEEWEKAGLVKTPSDASVAEMTPEERAKVSRTWNWNEVGMEKEVELGKETLDALRQMIDEKSEAKELTIADGALISLQAKL